MLFAERYRLRRELGGGAFGQVWLAWDDNMGRDVALKVLRPIGGVRPDKLMVDEAHRLVDLESPCITPIYDAAVYEPDDVAYITMKYVELGALPRVYGETGVCGSRIIVWTRSICTGLDLVHRKGILHRDVKPENVLLGPQDRAMLSDFGVAALLVNEEAPPHGDPAVRAPEGYTSGSLTVRSDLYSLGVSMRHMATGRYSGFELVPGLAVSALRDAAPHLPLALHRAVEWATQEDPADRPHSAAEFSKTIARIAIDRDWVRVVAVGKEQAAWHEPSWDVRVSVACRPTHPDRFEIRSRHGSGRRVRGVADTLATRRDLPAKLRGMFARLR